MECWSFPGLLVINFKKKKCFWVGRKYMPAAFMGCIKGLYPLESKQITPEEEF